MISTAALVSLECISCSSPEQITPLLYLIGAGAADTNGVYTPWEGYIRFDPVSATSTIDGNGILTVVYVANGTLDESICTDLTCGSTMPPEFIFGNFQWKVVATFQPDLANWDFLHATFTPIANPVPSIAQPLLPASAAPGGPDFTLTANGTGFVSGSVLNWNGSPRPTTFVSGAQITAAIAASDIAVASTANVTVVNPSPGGGTSNELFLPVTNPTNSVAFATATAATGSSPYAIAVADFNGDGKEDLAVSLNNGMVSVLLGNGDGTFQAPTAYPTMSNSLSVVATDVNHDGKTDLAVANSGTVSILLGNGDGTFQTQMSFPAGSGEAVSLIEGDFNLDGNIDLAVVGTNGNTPGTVSILLGNGDGTFQPPLSFGTGNEPFEVSTGDFNGDGRLDLAVAFVYGGVSILLGNGDGTFQPHIDYLCPPGSEPQSIVSADYNGDGKLDLVAADGGFPDVSVLIGNGDGTFLPAVQYPAGLNGFGPGYVRTADFNGDGRLDLGIVSAQAGLLLGNGDGTFGPYLPYSPFTSEARAAVGDFNGDGRMDFVVANFGGSTVSVLLQAPLVSLNPTLLSFGNQKVGTVSSPMVTTLTNSGSALLNVSTISVTGSQAGDFAQTNNCPNSLAAGNSCTINVVFDPTATGTRIASVTITDNATGSPQSIALTGTGTAPAVTLVPTNLTFADQLVGTTSTAQVVTMTNSGTAMLTITSIVASGDFTKTNTCGTGLPPGGSCTISVRFRPTAESTRTGLITVTDDSPGSPQTVSLTGAGTVVKLTPSALTFPTQLVGTLSAAKTVTLTNTGTVVLNITGITVGGTNRSDFTRTTTCGSTLAAGASCTVSVKFKPTAAGTRSASVSISDDGGGSPQTVGVTGTGTVVKLSPTSLSFGSIQVGKISKPQTITLTNTGTVTLNILSPGITITGTNPGDFGQNNTCQSSVPPGAACSIVVRFIPTAMGARSASVSITDDGGGSPQGVSLSGNGT